MVVHYEHVVPEARQVTGEEDSGVAETDNDVLL
jgi:hypothetical protein